MDNLKQPNNEVTDNDCLDYMKIYEKVNELYLIYKDIQKPEDELKEIILNMETLISGYIIDDRYTPKQLQKIKSSDSPSIAGKAAIQIHFIRLMEHSNIKE